MAVLNQPSFGRPYSLPPLPRQSGGHEGAAVYSFQAGDWCNRLPGLPVKRTKVLGGGGCNWTQRGRRGFSRPAELFRCPDPEPTPRRGQSLSAFSRQSSRNGTPRADLDAASVVASLTPRRSRQKLEGPMRAIKAAYLQANCGSYPEEDIRSTVGVSAPTESEETVQARIRRELAEMRTGDDAVAFFTRHSSNSHVKLLYCINGVYSGGELLTDGISPYDLLTVPEAKITSQMEYFTISASGVVHFRPGQLSECVALSEWIHQAMMYRVLTSMTFFRYYAHRKALNFWRQGARYDAYCRNRQRLARRCLFARPTFLGPLMQAKAIAAQVDNLTLLAIPEQCHHLDEFMELQTKFFKHPETGVQRVIDEKRDHVVSILEALVVSVSRAADAAMPTKLSKRASSFASSKSKSSAQERSELKAQQVRQQVVQEDVFSLGSCIRLASYMYQEALAARAVQAAQDVLRRVEGGPSAHKQKLFYVAAALGPVQQQVLLSPFEDQFQEAFHQLWDDLICSIDDSPPIEAARGLFCHVHGRHADDENIKFTRVRDILAGNRTWAGCLDATTRSLRSQFTEAQKLALEMYEPFRRIYDYGQQWDEAAFFRLHHSLESLLSKVNLLNKFQDELSQFRTQRPVGVLVIDARRLRDCLMPVPATSLAVICQQMIHTARELCVSTCRKADALIKELDERPKNSTELSSLIKTLEVAEKEEKQVQAAVDDVLTAHKLLNAQNVRVPLEVQVLFDSLVAKERELSSESLPAAKGFINQRMRDQQASPDSEMVITMDISIMESVGM